MKNKLSEKLKCLHNKQNEENTCVHVTPYIHFRRVFPYISMAPPDHVSMYKSYSLKKNRAESVR